VVEVRALAARAPDEHSIARAIADACERRDEHPAFGDAVWRDLETPGATSRGFVAIGEDAGESPIGYVRAMTRPDDAGALDLALGVLPEHREGDAPRALLDAALAHASEVAAHHVSLWVFGADVDTDALAASAGLEPERELWQMRVPLPLASKPVWPPRIRPRTFVPGTDDTAWLAVNNAAFAADPDQGGWTPEILAGRMAEPWFDPAGFLIADADGRIAGFCWTKVHRPAPPHEPLGLGEIYVIGVDPGYQGLGLGRALTIAGLAHLHDDRHVDVGMLFVDASNTAAVALYRALGFVTSRVDRAYSRSLS
jgi:mycothiol synthase